MPAVDRFVNSDGLKAAVTTVTLLYIYVGKCFVRLTHFLPLNFLSGIKQGSLNDRQTDGRLYSLPLKNE